MRSGEWPGFAISPSPRRCIHAPVKQAGYRCKHLEWADNLHDCLVYLDEAHTRGVDLKIPRDALGALTLALGQTKDHTVQGISVSLFSVPFLY